MKFDNAKNKYSDIEIPKELKTVVDKALDMYKDDESLSKIIHEEDENDRYLKKIHKKICLVVTAASIAACFLTFTIVLNASETFARSMENVHIIGKMAKVLTFTEYSDDNDNRSLSVSLPKVKEIANNDLENKINNEIRTKMNEVIKEAEKNAEEYKEAYLDTGGNEEDMFKTEINVDYEIKCSNEKYLSFMVYKSESAASYYYESFYYNIDLEIGKELTLRDLLGPDYINIVNKSVDKQIKERTKEDKNALFYGYGSDNDLKDEKFKSIDKNQTFYINSDNKVVVVFEKYSIAPGYMGEIEFVIE